MMGTGLQEIVPAEVLRIDYKGNNTERLYTVLCRLIGAVGSSPSGERISARPLDANIKRIPIKGEVVLLLKAPSAYASANSRSVEYYYLHPVSIQSSVHHNAIPGVTLVNKQDTSQTKSEKYSQTRNGFTDVSPTNGNPELIENWHQQRKDVSPLQPFSGDVLVESRWGSSFRLSSTLIDITEYAKKPTWGDGNGSKGSPIIILSNGHGNKFKNSKSPWNIESPDNDDSSMWLTSGQKVQFTPASSAMSSLKRLENDGFIKDNWAGISALIFSNRIVLNAKKNQVNIFGKTGVSVSSDSNVTIDAKKTVEIESKRINLGLDASHPSVLGDVLVQLLSKLCAELQSLSGNIMNLTVPTGAGLSGPPKNIASFRVNRTNIGTISDQLEKILSKLVFLNEDSSGQTSDLQLSDQEGDAQDNPSSSSDREEELL